MTTDRSCGATPGSEQLETLRQYWNSCESWKVSPEYGRVVAIFLDALRSLQSESRFAIIEQCAEVADSMQDSGIANCIRALKNAAPQAKQCGDGDERLGPVGPAGAAPSSAASAAATTSEMMNAGGRELRQHLYAGTICSNLSLESIAVRVYSAMKDAEPSVPSSEAVAIKNTHAGYLAGNGQVVADEAVSPASILLCECSTHCMGRHPSVCRNIPDNS